MTTEKGLKVTRENYHLYTTEELAKNAGLLRQMQKLVTLPLLPPKPTKDDEELRILYREELIERHLLAYLRRRTEDELYSSSMMLNFYEIMMQMIIYHDENELWEFLRPLARRLKLDEAQEQSFFSSISRKTRNALQRELAESSFEIKEAVRNENHGAVDVTAAEQARRVAQYRTEIKKSLI